MDATGGKVADIEKRPYGFKDLGDVNGDLIAAAPALLAALEAIVAVSEEHELVRDHWTEMDIARATIKAAKEGK